MSSSFKIGNRVVGPDSPPLVVAEIGINHEGSLAVAIELAASAIEAGAEIIKHQTHVVDDEMSPHAKSVIPGNASVSIYEIMRRCALSEPDERALMDFVHAHGAIFISTPFSRKAADRLVDFGVPAFKIGSGECNNYPFIEYVAKFGKPMIISTGMNTVESIRPTVDILRSYKIPYALLHCTNIYPTPPEYVRLQALNALAESYPDAVIGLSDHTETNDTSIAAVALGASIIERHYTDSYKRPGPDISSSMDQTALRNLLKSVDVVHRARGSFKGPIDAENPTIAFAFASVVVTKELKPGDILTHENIWPMRPSGGDFGPQDFAGLLGKQVVNGAQVGEWLKREDIAN